MKKLAVFVEGQTELIFASKLFLEVIGRKNLRIEQVRAQFGKKAPRSYQIVNATGAEGTEEYYILICDSCGDGTVKSDILELCENLQARGYERIIGLRDVFPLLLSDVPKLQAHLNSGFENKGIPIDILLSVMEIEAWFLAENNHFLRIDKSLTPENIKYLIWVFAWECR